MSYKAVFIGSLYLFQFQPSFADSQVIDVRRNITLSNEESPYKDFYLSGGKEAGFKVNQVVKAIRPLTIRDASGAQSYGQIQIPVGQIKIIAVYDRVAVGREFKLLSRDELPMLEQVGIMTGDQIDFNDAFIDKSSPKKRSPQATQSSVPSSPLVPTTQIAEQAPVEKLEIKAQSDN